MDSGNSGSIQSSSGGSEEYDSRAEAISAFLNNNPTGLVASMPNQPPPQPPPQHPHTHSSSSMFDPLSNYFDPLSRSPQLQSNPNSLLNLDMVWSKNIRSEPNCTDLGVFAASSSPTQQLLTNQQAQSRATFSSVQISQGPESTAKGSSVSGSSDHTNNSNSNMVRNSKKRSRASRRAPTTVLTTDTTNFRAMVQEFTGIPAPPFTSSSFPRSRLDLFGTASTMRSTHLEPSPPPYLLRPFAQKLHATPFISSSVTNSSSFPSSSAVDAIASTTSTNINSGSANATSTSTSINYQLPSELGLLKQPQNLLSMNVQNQILNFQSLVQSQQKYPLPNSSILGNKAQAPLDISSNTSALKMGALEEFGLGHGAHVNTNLGGLQSIVPSEGTLPRSDINTPPSWAEGAASHGNSQGLLRSINGGYTNSPRVSNGKANYPVASSSDFHGDKGPENVAPRTEGTLESWICSSE